MEVELVTIGHELLLGQTLDTNAAHLAGALASIGVRVARVSTVGDDAPTIEAVVSNALRRTGFVITTGGLGPTKDDITKKTIASLFAAPLDLDSGYLEQLRVRFQRLGRGPMPQSNRSQAEIPRGATILRNRWGTAPGLWLESEIGVAVMLPGVPREMQGLLETELIPRLQARAEGETGLVTRSKVYRTTGVSESALADGLTGVEERIRPLSLAYLPDLHGVDLRLTAWQMPPLAAAEALETGERILLPLLGEAYYGDGDLASVLVDTLRDRGARLAVAESCTGGLIGARITAIAGASDVFVGGVISYANEAKVELLGVSAESIDVHGAVSEPVALAMARGACQRFGAEAAVAVTGVAGPTGGTPDKPVGTVWMAARFMEHHRAVRRGFPGGRSDIRIRSAQGALDVLRRLILEAG